MEDELMKELENLREENKILRDSLTETRPDDSGEAETSAEKMLKDLGGMFTTAFTKAREQVRPGTEKLTETLSRQMEANPVPVLLAAFGAGYIVGRMFDRKD